MKNSLVFIVLFLLSISILKADTFHYTVVAKSGLSLRKEKSIDSEKILVAPYLSRVQVLGLFKQDVITVEDVKGFWVHVKYENKTGFMYSGFLYPGSFPYAEIQNNKSKFITLDEYGPEYSELENGEYQYLNFLLVDRYENWYGAHIDGKQTILTKVTITYEFTPKHIQPLYDLIQDGLEYYMEDGAPLPLNYNILPKDVFDFFIGTDEKLIAKTPSEIFYTQEIDQFGVYLYPWQKLHINNSSYFIQAKGVIEKTSEVNTIMYELSMNKYNSDLKVNIPLNANYYKIPIEKSVNSQSLRILWAGDLNSDDIPDLIVVPLITREGCGEVYNTLLMSNYKKDSFEYEISGWLNWNSLIIEKN